MIKYKDWDNLNIEKCNVFIQNKVLFPLISKKPVKSFVSLVMKASNTNVDKSFSTKAICNYIIRVPGDLPILKINN